MAGNTRRNWSTIDGSADDLQAAVSAVKNNKISLRRAEGVYDVPKSTIAFYVHGKAAISDKPGPQTILTASWGKVDML